MNKLTKNLSLIFSLAAIGLTIASVSIQMKTNRIFDQMEKAEQAFQTKRDSLFKDRLSKNASRTITIDSHYDEVTDSQTLEIIYPK